MDIFPEKSTLTKFNVPHIFILYVYGTKWNAHFQW